MLLKRLYCIIKERWKFPFNFDFFVENSTEICIFLLPRDVTISIWEVLLTQKNSGRSSTTSCRHLMMLARKPGVENNFLNPIFIDDGFNKTFWSPGQAYRADLAVVCILMGVEISRKQLRASLMGNLYDASKDKEFLSVCWIGWNSNICVTCLTHAIR